MFHLLFLTLIPFILLVPEGSALNTTVGIAQCSGSTPALGHQTNPPVVPAATGLLEPAQPQEDVDDKGASSRHGYAERCDAMEKMFMEMAMQTQTEADSTSGSNSSQWTPFLSLTDPYSITIQGHKTKPFCFRIVFYAPTTPITAFDLLADVLRRHEWDELIDLAKLVEKLGHGDAIQYVKMKAIWPTAARDSVLLARITEVAINGTVSGGRPKRGFLNVSQSIEDSRIPENTAAGIVRMEAGIAGQLVTEASLEDRKRLGLVGDKWCRVIQIADGDLKGWIPTSVLKFVATQALPRSLNKVCAQLADMPVAAESQLLARLAAQTGDKKVASPRDTAAADSRSSGLVAREVSPAAADGDSVEQGDDAGAGAQGLQGSNTSNRRHQQMDDDVSASSTALARNTAASSSNNGRRLAARLGGTNNNSGKLSAWLKVLLRYATPAVIAAITSIIVTILFGNGHMQFFLDDDTVVPIRLYSTSNAPRRQAWTVGARGGDSETAPRRAERSIPGYPFIRFADDDDYDGSFSFDALNALRSAYADSPLSDIQGQMRRLQQQRAQLQLQRTLLAEQLNEHRRMERQLDQYQRYLEHQRPVHMRQVARDARDAYLARLKNDEERRRQLEIHENAQRAAAQAKAKREALARASDAAKNHSGDADDDDDVVFYPPFHFFNHILNNQLSSQDEVASKQAQKSALGDLLDTYFGPGGWHSGSTKSGAAAPAPAQQQQKQAAKTTRSPSPQTVNNSNNESKQIRAPEQIRAFPLSLNTKAPVALHDVPSIDQGIIDNVLRVVRNRLDQIGAEEDDESLARRRSSAQQQPQKQQLEQQQQPKRQVPAPSGTGSNGFKERRKSSDSDNSIRVDVVDEPRPKQEKEGLPREPVSSRQHSRSPRDSSPEGTAVEVEEPTDYRKAAESLRKRVDSLNDGNMFLSLSPLLGSRDDDDEEKDMWSPSEKEEEEEEEPADQTTSRRDPDQDTRSTAMDVDETETAAKDHYHHDHDHDEHSDIEFSRLLNNCKCQLRNMQGAASAAAATEDGSGSEAALSTRRSRKHHRNRRNRYARPNSQQQQQQEQEQEQEQAEEESAAAPAQSLKRHRDTQHGYADQKRGARKPRGERRAPEQTSEPSAAAPTPASAQVDGNDSSAKEKAEEYEHAQKVQVSLSQLREIGRALDGVREDYNRRLRDTQLSFIADNEGHLKLAYNRGNSAFHEYQETLQKLLFRLDEISSHGDVDVRDKRKAIVRKIQNTLDALDQFAADQESELSESSPYEFSSWADESSNAD
ncbi:hypothetical protein IWW48_004318 [Coemansia sp. RSA 1200]|nr:hypothetical protein IWW48_004318 [Coemansia sp. RSA 1200]